LFNQPVFGIRIRWTAINKPPESGFESGKNIQILSKILKNSEKVQYFFNLIIYCLSGFDKIHKTYLQIRNTASNEVVLLETYRCAFSGESCCHDWRISSQSPSEYRKTRS